MDEDTDLKSAGCKSFRGSIPLPSAVTMVLMVSTTDCGSVSTDSNSVSHPNGELQER